MLRFMPAKMGLLLQHRCRRQSEHLRMRMRFAVAMTLHPSESSRCSALLTAPTTIVVLRQPLPCVRMSEWVGGWVGGCLYLIVTKARGARMYMNELAQLTIRRLE